jgi:hypothetical protein
VVGIETIEQLRGLLGARVQKFLFRDLAVVIGVGAVEQGAVAGLRQRQGARE